MTVDRVFSSPAISTGSPVTLWYRTVMASTLLHSNIEVFHFESCSFASAAFLPRCQLLALDAGVAVVVLESSPSLFSPPLVRSFLFVQFWNGVVGRNLEAMLTQSLM